MKYPLAIALVTTALGFAGSVAAQDMVFTSWGGTTQDAQRTNWADGFSSESKINITQDGPTD